jgi:hypothetical protein
MTAFGVRHVVMCVSRVRRQRSWHMRCVLRARRQQAVRVRAADLVRSLKMWAGCIKGQGNSASAAPQPRLALEEDVIALALTVRIAKVRACQDRLLAPDGPIHARDTRVCSLAGAYVRRFHARNTSDLIFKLFLGSTVDCRWTTQGRCAATGDCALPPLSLL